MLVLSWEEFPLDILCTLKATKVVKCCQTFCDFFSVLLVGKNAGFVVSIFVFPLFVKVQTYGKPTHTLTHLLLILDRRQQNKGC